jgi:hypothetical protein
MSSTNTRPTITLGISYFLLMFMALVHLVFGFVLALHQVFGTPVLCYSKLNPTDTDYKERDRTWGSRQWCQSQDHFINEWDPSTIGNASDIRFAYYECTSGIFITKGMFPLTISILVTLPMLHEVNMTLRYIHVLKQSILYSSKMGK